ncbi:hypothetical protein ANCCAN_07965 [Ancylostoma caninum]|uniref:Uncharacterized protein n=1 Tax=Ancylostoma caninum TaxID=29170 RepID=A0A368GQZ7_ANCCA|nr:hypothetical protein ANCCAN_07965 [Ancylostoma caninum]
MSGYSGNDGAVFTGLKPVSKTCSTHTKFPGDRADPLAMDGFAEANLLLSSALEQLDDLIINGSKPAPSSGSGSSPTCKALLSATKGMRDIDEGLDLENTNVHDADDDRSTKASDWSSKDWRDQTGSDGSSGVESPPSDIPTSSSSLYNPPKIYNEFVKAIEEHAITERPDLETQLKIMQWLTGRSVSAFSKHFSL